MIYVTFKTGSGNLSYKSFPDHAEAWSFIYQLEQLIVKGEIPKQSVVLTDDECNVERVALPMTNK